MIVTYLSASLVSHKRDRHVCASSGKVCFTQTGSLGDTRVDTTAKTTVGGVDDKLVKGHKDQALFKSWRQTAHQLNNCTPPHTETYQVLVGNFWSNVGFAGLKVCWGCVNSVKDDTKEAAGAEASFVTTHFGGGNHLH